MAVSKRLRFEILRRDGHRCKYCGRDASEVKLTVDHVNPTALGGTDAPENLAAACGDCNNGKTSVPADAAVVADVEQKVIAWAVARKHVAAEMEQEFTDQTAAAKRIRSVFMKSCKEEHGAEPKIPADWASSISRWLQLGISEARARELAAYAACRHNVPLAAKWKYLAASCWAVIREMEDRAQKLVDPTSPAVDTPTGCTCLDDHSADSCLADALWGEWYGAWKRSTGCRPPDKTEEDFVDAAYAALEDQDASRVDIFIAARTAGTSESTDLAGHLAEAVKADPERLDENATAAWVADWAKRSPDAAPTEAQRAEFALHLNAARRADYKPDAIVLMSALAGHLLEPRLGKFFASPEGLIAMDNEPWPDPEIAVAPPA